MNKILGAIICFIVAICTMPAIAAPPDSPPPRAEHPKENIESAMPSPAPIFVAFYAEKSCSTSRNGEYSIYYKNERRSYDGVTRTGIAEHYDIGDH